MAVIIKLEKACNFISKNKHFFILLLFIPLQIWFEHLEMTVTAKYITDVAFDHQIPFIKEFVIAYVLLFPYLAYGIIYTGLHSKRDFYRLVIFLLGTMTISLTAYSIFPNGQNLRPVITQHDPFSMLVKFIYTADTPTDVCPSMHVIDAIAINAALQHSDAFAAKKYRRHISTVIMLAMCFSTVFIKQHSVLDVFCGIITAAVFYIPLYVVPKLKLRNKAAVLAGQSENDIDIVAESTKAQGVQYSNKIYAKSGK